MRTWISPAIITNLAIALVASFLLSGCSQAEEPGQHAVAPPDGWVSMPRKSNQLFERTYPKGTLTVHISDWTRAEGRTPRAWLETIASEAVPGEKVIGQDDKVTDGPGDGIVNIVRYVRRKRGQDRLSIRFVCPNRGHLRLIDAYMQKAIWRNAAGQQTRTDLLALVDTACRQGPPLKRPDIAPGKAPEGMSAIWYIGDFVVGMSGYEVDRWAAMTFKDGSVTDNLSDTVTNGPAASKRNNPNDWGQRRKAGRDIEIKWNGSSSFSDYYLTMKSKPGGQDDRVDGCFGSFFISSLPSYGQGAYNTATQSNLWCFSKDGRFSNESSTSISASTGDSPVFGTTVGSGYSNSGLNGWYRIDGHVLQLVYDDGQNATTSIGFLDRDNPEKRAILLGSKYLN